MRRTPFISHCSEFPFVFARLNGATPKFIFFSDIPLSGPRLRPHPAKNPEAHSGVWRPPRWSAMAGPLDLKLAGVLAALESQARSGLAQAVIFINTDTEDCHISKPVPWSRRGQICSPFNPHHHGPTSPTHQISTTITMTDTGDDVWKAVEPQGLALAILVTTLTFTALTTIVMGMRVFIRVKTGHFGTDDWIMSAGYVSFFLSSFHTNLQVANRRPVGQLGAIHRRHLRFVFGHRHQREPPELCDEHRRLQSMFVSSRQGSKGSEFQFHADSV